MLGKAVYEVGMLRSIELERKIKCGKYHGLYMHLCDQT